MSAQGSAAYPSEARPARIPVLGVGIDPLTLQEATALCLRWLEEGVPRLIVTPNAEILYQATRDAELAKLLAEADLVVPDGIGVIIGARLAGRRLPERVAGVDLAAAIMRELGRQGGSVYVLGASPASNADCARRLPELFPGLRVVGSHDGYFGPDQDSSIVAAIKVAHPDFLLAGMGAPKQEKWLAQRLSGLGVGLAIGIGGGIDLWAGHAPRAPRWVQRVGMEWLYRMVKLGRYRRVLPALARFLFAAMRDR